MLSLRFTLFELRKKIVFKSTTATEGCKSSLSNRPHWCEFVYCNCLDRPCELFLWTSERQSERFLLSGEEKEQRERVGGGRAAYSVLAEGWRLSEQRGGRQRGSQLEQRERKRGVDGEKKCVWMSSAALLTGWLRVSVCVCVSGRDQETGERVDTTTALDAWSFTKTPKKGRDIF